MMCSSAAKIKIWYLCDILFNPLPLRILPSRVSVEKTAIANTVQSICLGIGTLAFLQ